MTCTPLRNTSTSKLCICTAASPLLEIAILREHHVVSTIEEVTPKLRGAKVFSIVDVKCGYWNVELDDESTIPSSVRTPGGHVFSVRYTDQPKTCRLCDSPGHLATHCPKGTRSVRENEKPPPNNEQASVQQPAVRSYSDVINGFQAPPQSEREVNEPRQHRPTSHSSRRNSRNLSGGHTGGGTSRWSGDRALSWGIRSAHGGTCTKCNTHSSQTPTSLWKGQSPVS